MQKMGGSALGGIAITAKAANIDVAISPGTRNNQQVLPQNKPAKINRIINGFSIHK
jgi:hypothetical protein